MVEYRHRLCWLALITTYWFFALWLLFSVFPIYVDSGGPSASLSWRDQSTAPTMAEYHHSKGIRLLFLYPYWITASVITLLGCGLTSSLVRFWRPRSSHLFLLSSATALVLLLLVAAISDIGSAAHLWRGPMMYVAVTSFLAGLKVVIPMSILSGFVLFIRDRLMHGQT